MLFVAAVALGVVLPWHPPLAECILHVVFPRPKKQVGRVNAQPIVAAVAHIIARGHRRNVYLIAHPVC